MSAKRSTDAALFVELFERLHFMRPPSAPLALVPAHHLLPVAGDGFCAGGDHQGHSHIALLCGLHTTIHAIGCPLATCVAVSWEFSPSLVVGQRAVGCGDDRRVARQCHDVTAPEIPNQSGGVTPR